MEYAVDEFYEYPFSEPMPSKTIGKRHVFGMINAVNIKEIFFSIFNHKVRKEKKNNNTKKLKGILF